MSALNEILGHKIEELKKKRFEDFSPYIKDVFSSVEVVEGKKYYFEIQAFPINDGLKVSVECSVRKFFFNFFGRQRYLLVSKNGQIKDMDGNDFHGRK